jgi:hypothetical protein
MCAFKLVITTWAHLDGQSWRGLLQLEMIRKTRTREGILSIDKLLEKLMIVAWATKVLDAGQTGSSNIG